MELQYLRDMIALEVPSDVAKALNDTYLAGKNLPRSSIKAAVILFRTTKAYRRTFYAWRNSAIVQARIQTKVRVAAWLEIAEIEYESEIVHNYDKAALRMTTLCVLINHPSNRNFFPEQFIAACNEIERMRLIGRK